MLLQLGVGLGLHEDSTANANTCGTTKRLRIEQAFYRLSTTSANRGAARGIIAALVLTPSRHAVLVLCLLAGCASRSARAPTPGAANAVAPAAAGAPAPAATATAPDAGDEAAVAENDDAAMEGDDSEGEGEGGFDPERESRNASTDGGSEAPRYTVDLSDAALGQKWKNDLASLGSISLGFADEGRLINGEQFPAGEGYTVVSPEKTWGTTETVNYVLEAIRAVRQQEPNAPPLRVNQISGKEGGYLRPHHSHQNGRDVDLAFYYPTADPIRVREREKYIDVKLNWELLKALVTRTDVEFILVDRRVQKVLYDYALRAGEDPKWLDSLFHAGRDSLLFHARGHRDHFHVRFFNARAQELGRRVSPLLAQRPDENRVFHRVHQGDTLGALARKYGSSVAAIEKVNHMKSSFLHLSQVLQIPLRGPCTKCPIPAAVTLPPRRLPPGPGATAVASRAAPPPAAAVVTPAAVAPTAAPPATVPAVATSHAPEAVLASSPPSAGVEPIGAAEVVPTPLTPSVGSARTSSTTDTAIENPGF